MKRLLGLFGQTTPFDEIDATLTGDLITDAIRTTNAEGDGRASPDSSIGIYPAYSNLGTNGNAASATTGWNTGGVGTISRITTDAKLGSTCFRLLANASGALAQGGGVSGSPLTKTTYALAVWMKGVGTGIGKNSSVGMNETGGASGQASIGVGGGVLTGDWQEFYVIGPMAQSDRTGISCRIGISSPVTDNEVLFGGVRCGPASVVLPYAHTAGSTASKTAGRIQLLSAGLTPTQGWAALRVRPSWTGNESGNNVLWRPAMPITLWQWKADASNLIALTFDGGRLMLTRTSTDGSEHAAVCALPTRNTPFTVVAQWTADGVALSVNGGSLSRSYDAIMTDDFERADTVTGLGSATTGQSWVVTGASTPKITDGRYTATGASAGNGYAGIDLGETPARIGGIVSHTVADMNTTLIMSTDSDFSLANMVHLFNDHNNTTLQVRVGGGSFISLASFGYSPAIATDGTPYEVWLAVDGDTASWMGADGKVYSVTDSRIGDLAGRYCTWEVSSNGSGAYSRWDSVYAERHAAGYPSDAMIPTGLPSTVDIGSDAGSAGHVCGDVLWVAMGTGVLSDANAALVSALTDDPARSNIPSQAQVRYIWDGAGIAA